MAQPLQFTNQRELMTNGGADDETVTAHNND
jgi:hypothetical protein